MREPARTVYSLTGATAGATAAFLIARYLASDWVNRRASGWIKQVIDGVEQEGWRFVAFVRLIPLFPFNPLNYVLGLTRISLAQYVVASFIFMFPGALAYTYLGYAGREAIAGGEDLISERAISARPAGDRGLPAIPGEAFPRRSACASKPEALCCGAQATPQSTRGHSSIGRSFLKGLRRRTRPHRGFVQHTARPASPTNLDPSCNAILRPQRAAPSTCASAPSGSTTVPASTTIVSFSTITAPLPRSDPHACDAGDPSRHIAFLSKCGRDAKPRVLRHVGSPACLLRRTTAAWRFAPPTAFGAEPGVASRAIQQADAEGDRIGARRTGRLVHEKLSTAQLVQPGPDRALASRDGKRCWRHRSTAPVRAARLHYANGLRLQSRRDHRACHVTLSP